MKFRLSRTNTVSVRNFGLLQDADKGASIALDKHFTMRYQMVERLFAARSKDNGCSTDQSGTVREDYRSRSMEKWVTKTRNWPAQEK